MEVDNILAYSFSDHITESFGGDRFKELAESLPSSHISAEWVATIFRLYNERPESMQSVEIGDLLAYAALESHKMEQLDWLNNIDLNELEKNDLLRLIYPARSMYYAHSSVIPMDRRQDRLLLAANVLERAEKQLSSPDTFMIRQAASMYEEVAFYEVFSGRSEVPQRKATELNLRIVDSEVSWRYPFKAHALLSLFDMKSYEIMANANRSYTPDSATRRDFIELQLDYYNELSKYANCIINLDSDLKSLARNMPENRRSKFLTTEGGALGVMIGVATEAIVLGVGRDYLIESGQQDTFWLKQSFMRQDAMSSSGSYPLNLSVPNLTFDLQLFNYRDFSVPPKNIEVKKKSNGKPASILPGIEIVSIRNGSKPEVFAQLIMDYCDGQIIAYSQNRIRKSERQKEVRRYFHEAVKPERLIPAA